MNPLYAGKGEAMFMRTFLLAGMMVLLLPLAAFGFRWGGKIVRVGDTKAAVEAKCGTPTSTEVSSAVTTGDNTSGARHRFDQPQKSYNEVTQTIETWTYDFGPSKLIRILRFQGDTLKSMNTGGYGFAKWRNGVGSWHVIKKWFQNALRGIHRTKARTIRIEPWGIFTI